MEKCLRMAIIVPAELGGTEQPIENVSQRVSPMTHQMCCPRLGLIGRRVECSVDNAGVHVCERQSHDQAAANKDVDACL
jgi:hypothetical protein